jgi:hypothetical protein
MRGIVRGASIVALAIAVDIALAPRVALGEPTHNAAMAEALFREGRELVRAGHYAEACPKFAESQRLDPGTGTLLNLASCYEAISKYASAWGLYREVEALAAREGHRERERFAVTRAKDLESKFGHVTISVEKPAKDLVVSSDGEPLREASWGSAIPMDPGTHVISAAAPGRAPFQKSVEVAALVVVPVRIPELAPAPGPPPPEAATEPKKSVVAPETEAPPPRASVWRPVGWAAVAVGGAALAAGAVAGLVAMSKNEDANANHCNPRDCDARGVELLDSATTIGNLSTGLFIGGAVVAAAGVILVLTAPSAHRTDAAARWPFGPAVF